MSLDELKQVHAKIILQETNVAIMDLYIKYHHGMLYLAAYRKADASNYRKWFHEKLGIVYNFALRYMTCSLLIKKYPRLLICELSFSQLLKHNKVMQSFLNAEKEGLKEGLGMT